MSTFRWAEGYPRKGWHNIDIVDHGHGNYIKCVMCNNPEVRYEHIMKHETGIRLGVGCVCAEHMDVEYKGQIAEDNMKKEAVRRNNFLKNAWHKNTDNILRKLGKDKITITEVNGEYYWLVEKDTDEYSNVYIATPCSSEIEAKRDVWQMYKDEEWI